MRIVSSDFDGLVESLGASRRLATRIGALARAGLFVTETLVEVAVDSDGKPLSDLLLSKALLDAASQIDATALAKLAKGKWFKDNPVALVQRDSRRVICLAEESTVEPSPAAATTNLAKSPNASTMLAPEEANRLLSAPELSRLKLELATSAETGRRLEALRKLYLSNLPAQEKSALFLSALRDREAEVRAEAARGLGAMGLDSSLTENLATSSGGSGGERLVAVTNIGQLLPRLEDSQRQLAVVALLELLKPTEDREIVLAVLAMLGHRLADLPGVASLVPRLHQQLVALLQVHFARFNDAARGVFGALFKADRATAGALVTRTLEDIAQEDLRFLLLSMITTHDMQAAKSPAVVAQFVRGLTTGSELDRNYQSCAAALTQLGDAAIAPLLESLHSADDTGRRRIIDLLGHMLRGGEGMAPITDASASLAVTACLDLYPGGNAELRTSILESGVIRHPALDEALRLRAVRGFVDSLHEFRFERQIELVQLALTQCGQAALKPLHTAMLESAHDVTRLSAALLLPRILEATPDAKPDFMRDLVADLRLLVEAEESDFPDRGPLFIALGRTCAHSNYPAADADTQSRFLRDVVGRTSAVYDVLEALGYIASGANVSGVERLEVGYLLLGVLKKGIPGPSVRTRRNAEGEEVLHFGRETTAYTDMIPRILEGLGRMVEAPATPGALFTRIARDLITIWTEITDYKRIWAPAATMSLANLLGQIATGKRRPDEMVDEIAELLSRRLILLPVLQVICQIAASRTNGESMDRLSGRIFQELAKRLNGEPAPEFTERRQLLQTMTALVQRAKLGERDKEIEQARRVVVEALFDAMRDKVPVARSLLDQLAKGEHIPAALREDITRRLKPAGDRSA